MPDEAPVQANLPLSPEPVAAATVTPSQPSAAPENSVSPAQPGLLDQVKEFGFEGVTTEDEARSRLLSDYKRLRDEYAAVEAQRPLIKYGQEYLDSLRQQSVAPQQQQAPAPEPSDHPWWKAPKFDAALADRYRTVGPDGEPTWKPDTPASIRAAADEYQAHIQQWTYDLATRPHEVLPEIIRAEASKLFEEFYSQRTSQQTEQEFVEEFRTNNQWLYELDPRTQKPMNDPFTGQPRYSAEGQQFIEILSRPALQKLPLVDQLSEAKYIYDLTRKNVPTETPPALQPPAQLAQTAAQKRQTAARQASRAIPQRNGSEPDPTERPRAQNRNKSVGELVYEQMRNEGALSAP